MMSAELRRYRDRPPELQLVLDALEVFLVQLFLRRYIKYCARHRRYAANAAARLYANLRSTVA